MSEFPCDTCEKQFKLKRTLEAHKMIHTGEKPYECAQCQQRFRQYSSLQKHQRTHSGAKPYECEECKQAFSQISNLKRHQRKHSNEKPFKCEECGKQFITSQNYQQHNSKHQQDRKQYKCESGCGKTYFYMCSLKKHEKEMHQKKEKPIFTTESYNQQIKNLKDFFTCNHPQVIHKNHVDVLFNGCLYYYNEENQKIEYHELVDGGKLECDPVKDHQHFQKNQQFAQIDCSQCPQEVNCCLATNQGNIQESEYPQSYVLHYHGPNCGHPIVLHNGHVDYLVNEMLHYPHDGHCDNHGILNRITVQ
ncbi:unnamed protein product (macronuclear) [Paramecium tetraurelia]|uniref:C2H2-type domain-containing protein n=1 Tax=Paramecium tetraurelia TaxID=5888 RepID=A0E0U6_PARTE|nr:uncharacterized protein GSPATT00022081001 [Paramecium tetraurelia]CAK88913.1 unnamed protein product [Paramecium tetraurelia]|eukprot:XP_001456310.1 hypothetical protein (macronuclear) [Paramecium tetraurelia strain d4-2]